MTGVRLSIVVLSWNTRALLRACLASLQQDDPSAARETIVVDNASADGSADMVASEFPWAKLVRNAENRLYAEGNNQGALEATGTYLCLLNSDTEVRPGALERLAEFLEAHPDYGAVAPRLSNPDGSVQCACRRFPGLVDAVFESTTLGTFPPGSWVQSWVNMGDFDHLRSRDVPQPPAACLVLRREEYLAMGGLDPALSLFFNDVDLCRRLWARDRRIRYLAEAEVLHHGGGSVRAADQRGRNLAWARNRAVYYRKHHGRLGACWLRGVVRLWSLECGMRIRLGPRDAQAKRVALDDLREFLRQCRAD